MTAPHDSHRIPPEVHHPIAPDTRPVDMHPRPADMDPEEHVHSHVRHLQELQEARLAEIEQTLVGRIHHLEDEVARITAFADAMHGNAYTGGQRFKRPVFRVVRGDKNHPSIIAFDAGPIYAWANRIYKQGRSAKLAYGYAVVALAVIGALAFGKIAVLVNPAAPAVGVAVEHHARRRQASTSSPAELSTRRSARYDLPPPFVRVKKHHPPLPITRFLAPPAPATSPMSTPRPSSSGSLSATPGTSSPAPASSSPSPSPSSSAPDSSAPATGLAPATNEETPAPSSG